LQQRFTAKSSLNFGENIGLRSIYYWFGLKSILFEFQMLVKVILFIVRVPVLSEQMLFAPPIVSQAYILRTRLLSSSILLTEKANDSVTDNGKP